MRPNPALEALILVGGVLYLSTALVRSHDVAGQLVGGVLVGSVLATLAVLSEDWLRQRTVLSLGIVLGAGLTFSYVTDYAETAVAAFAVVFGLVVLSHRVVERLGDSS